MFKWSVKGIVGYWNRGEKGEGALEDQLPDWLLTLN